jgi:hypothetical protein
VLHVRLHLVSKTVHERSLELPVPMRDARTAAHCSLLLDRESHPPAAAIDRVAVAVESDSRARSSTVFAAHAPAAVRPSRCPR